MTQVLTQDVLTNIAKPIEAARGLPNAAFTSPEFLELEDKTLFRRNWVFAGRQS